MSLLSKLRAILTLGRGLTRGITKLTAGEDPIALFQEWYDEAKRSGILLPESMCVATATPDGAPSARMMLLKGVDERGFVFYTNYESRKGEELAENPTAALVFHWPILERQVRVEGPVDKLPTEESESYFRCRPRGSRIGAWASDQSRPLADREILERRFAEYDEEYPGGEVPLPPFWGGYRLEPHRIEFWQGQINRLHDRLRYEWDGETWRVERLYP